MLDLLIFPSLSLNLLVIMFIFLSFSTAVWRNHLIQFSRWLVYSVHLCRDIFSIKIEIGNYIFILISNFRQQPVCAPLFLWETEREISKLSSDAQFLFRTFFSIYHCRFLGSRFSLFSLAFLFHAVNFYQKFDDSYSFKC